MSNTASSSPHHYPTIASKPDLPQIEARILTKWSRERTFQASIDQQSDQNEYVFYDGPPFANGLPHHGHLLTGYVKDVVPRYQTMRGQRVERRFGWDCHGLPAEMETEKDLGLSGRVAINDFGIQEFNSHCRKSVLRYTREWQHTVTKQARWVDFENEYKTMDIDYMESVMWAFKQLWDNGLIYEAYRVMPYSWGAETPLSNFEIRLDDATRPRQDPALTVAFDLTPIPSDPGPMQILAWTTTPWTLPSNLALAVGPDIDYSIVEHDGSFWILGTETLCNYEAQLGQVSKVNNLKGRELLGRKYVPLLPFFQQRQDAFRILSADFVDTTNGTGVVHLAPGFGEDDQAVCEANGISIGSAVPVDDQGSFTDDVPQWEGMNVFDANPHITRYLKELGRVIRHDTYEHNYPHCWRTDTPIIYKAISSWYVEVTKIREKLLELNQRINWIPEHVRDGRFGMWLDGARDWSISRNRFWGTPLPVWRSDNPEYPRVDVYGSLDELETDFGTRPKDLHRPFIDELTRPNPDDPSGRSTMRRTEEVLDCWFESGSMPFAQVHYPFENKAWFEEHFPADFIVEYINQTRGWFYTLHVLAGALFEKPAFKNVICHGILLADDGAKLSKKLRNYTEPSEIFENQGSDALRWYFMSSTIVRGGDTRISDQGIDDVVRQVITPIWNAFSFFTMYANADGVSASHRANATGILDRYILAKTRLLIEAVTTHMDNYDLQAATGEIQQFIDALNNWYIRRSRSRFWAPAAEADAEDKADAYDTLYTVLSTLTQVAAPFLPMITEEIYTGLTGKKSVHLTAWPDPTTLPDDVRLVTAMDKTREIVSAALRLREEEGRRVRMPLPKLIVAGRNATDLGHFVDLIADEVNVKSVDLSNDLGAHAQFQLRPNGKSLGPRLGADVQSVFKAAKSQQWNLDENGSVQIAGHVLSPNEYDLALVAPEGVVAAALPGNEEVIVLNTEVTPTLLAEGIARDIVRQIQEARKTQDLVVTDRIKLWLALENDARAAVKAHEQYVLDQVLAKTVIYGHGPSSLKAHDSFIDETAVSIWIQVIDA